MRLVVLGLNHKTVPVTIREQFAVSEESARSGLRHLDEQSGINEAVILSTCNRTEIYAVLGDAGSREGLMKFFLALSGNSESRDEYFFYYEGEECIRHLFEVASGLDSMVIGEGGILNQIKTAYTLALAEKATKTILNTLFHRAITTGKRKNRDADCIQCRLSQLCSGKTGRENFKRPGRQERYGIWRRRSS